MRIKYLSLRESSVLRKFAILFLICLISPILILLFLSSRLSHEGNIPSEYVENVLLLASLGIAIAFWTMRSIIAGFSESSRKNRNALLGILEKTRSQETSSEGNEILLLTRTFSEVKTRLEEDIRQLKLTKHSLHSVMTKMTEGFSSARSPEDILQLTLDALTGALMSTTGIIFKIKKGTNEAFIKVASGINASEYKEMSFKPDHPLLEAAIKNRACLQISDIPPDIMGPLKFAHFPVVCTPVVVRNEVLGVILVCSREIKDPYEEDDLLLLQNVATQVGLLMDNEELKFLADTDPLTGLFNRRHLMIALEYEINRIKRYEGTLSILMIDIDNFKSFNDTCGHLEGDLLLKEIAEQLKKGLRVTDIICRYGGDEFTALLPGTPLDSARMLTQRLLSELNSLPSKSKTTISIGGAEFSREMNRDQFLAKADAALYEAKNRGKNQSFFS